MNKKSTINVLVDGVGGDVGQGVIKALKDSSLNLKIYAACISNDSSWLYNIPDSYIFPYVSDKNYISFLIKFLNTHKIDVYFPTIDSSLLKISSYKKEIEEHSNSIIFIDDLKKIKICDDKFSTINFLKENHFTYPISTELLSDDIDSFIKKVSYPLILKPKSGNGAKEIKIVNNPQDFSQYIDDKNWMLQEQLNISHEITSGIYIGDDHEVKSIYILKRELRNGSTYKAERIIDKVLEKKLLDIAKKMDMKYINIQAVYEDGILYPFEFNGRLSGTTGAMRSVYNVPENFIRERILKKTVSKSTNHNKFYFTRYYEEIIYTEQDREELIKRSNTNYDKQKTNYL